MTTRMLQRRDTSANWAAVNPVLGDGEIGVEKDTGEFKIGNGVTHWNDLIYPYATAAMLASKADLVGGVIPTSQLPAVATGQTVTVASQAAMLALTAAQVQPGDIAIRSDQSGHRWILAATDPSVLTNWIPLETPDGVSSVNGQAGAVVLGPADVGAQPVDQDLTDISALDATAGGVIGSSATGWVRKTYAQLKTALGLVKADVGLGNVDNTSDANKPVSTAQQAALDTKQPLASQLTSIAGLALAGQAGKVLTVNPTSNGYELDVPAASGSGIPPTIVDAVGDLIVGTAADTVGRLARGTTGQRLSVKADGTLEWVTPYAGADKVTKTGDTMTGPLTVPAVAASGLTGAVAASRYVGATVSGAPTTGTFLKGDWIIDQTAAVWVCTVAGSPGTWVKAGGSSSGGVTVVAGYTDNHSLSSVTLSTSPVWTQMSNGVTISCGPSGIITLEFNALVLISTTSGSAMVFVTAARDTTDAGNAFSSSVGGGVSQGYSAANSSPYQSPMGLRVITGLTPGTSYTFYVMGRASVTSATVSYKYNGSSSSIPEPYATLKATTY